MSVRMRCKKIHLTKNTGVDVTYKHKRVILLGITNIEGFVI